MTVRMESMRNQKAPQSSDLHQVHDIQQPQLPQPAQSYHPLAYPLSAKKGASICMLVITLLIVSTSMHPTSYKLAFAQLLVCVKT